MNSYFELRKTSFCVAYTDVGEGREQEALSFANLRNSPLLRAIRRLKPDFSEYNLFRQELIRGSLSISIQLKGQTVQKIKSLQKMVAC